MSEASAVASLLDTDWLVIGGEVVDPQGVQFRDLSKVRYVGTYATRGKAYDAWRHQSMLNIDNALMKFLIIPIRLD